MVSTYEIAPSPVLQPFVRCFLYREFDATASELCRPMVASHEFVITFNLNDEQVLYRPPESGSPQTDEGMKSMMVMTGTSTQHTGFMVGKYRHRFFSIQFQPTGFYRIFGIPAVVFTNLMVQSPEDCKKSFLFLYEQLRETREINDMKTRCENYLLRELVSSTAKDPYNGILFIASRIVKSVGWLPVEKLASEANMSLKTFERKFTEQVGVRPKLYNRIVRFNKALAMKRGSPSPHWTSIAHACGYFDQMHFIKDFKLFSGVTPTDFFRQSPLPNEDVLKT